MRLRTILKTLFLGFLSLTIIVLAIGMAWQAYHQSQVYEEMREKVLGPDLPHFEPVGEIQKSYPFPLEEPPK